MAKTALKLAPKKAAKKTAPKKAAKKAAKKATKKAAKKGAGNPHPAHDLRRAYEHIGRVRALHLGLQPVALDMVDTLTRMAQATMTADDSKSSADLLRAAEHVSFAYLSSPAPDESLTLPLIAALHDQFDHLMQRAEDHAPTGRGEMRALYGTLHTEANLAMERKAFHRALEFARAAEAVTHATVAPQQKLPAGEMSLRLR